MATDKYAWEHAVDVLPHSSGDENTFISKFPAWGYPGLKRIAGSIAMAEASVAAQKTCPAGFSVHNFQAQFCRPGIWGEKIIYKVLRASTASKFCVRTVQAIQNDEVKAVISMSFFKTELDDQPPQPYDYIPPARGDVPRIAGRGFDKELDDFNFPRILNVPKETPYPEFESERVEVTKDADIGDRIYRVKLRCLSEVSSREKQILWVIWASDMYAVDGPLWIQGLNFGIPEIGDRTKTRGPSMLENFASLNHSLHFVRFSGWDVHQGILFEVKTKWAKGRRAVVTNTIRDVRGDPIATCEQEGYFVFNRGKAGFGPGTLNDEGIKKLAEVNDKAKARI